MGAPGQVQRDCKNVPDQTQQNSAKFPDKNPGSFSAKPGEVQQESGKKSGKDSRRLDARPSQVQQGSGEASRKGSGNDYGSVWC